MRLSLDPQFLVAVMFASTRCAAFFFVAPPFQGMLPPTVRAGLALSLGVAVAPRLATTTLPTEDTARIIAGLVYQVGVGLALGFLVYLAFQAVAAAGTAIDVFSGFSGAQLFDPLSKSNASPMSRIYQLLATVTLFATGGHLLIVAGLARSFDAAPMGGLRLDRMGQLLIADLGSFLGAALQIGAPVLGALFIAELLLGLAGKAAPMMNVMLVGFSLKSLVVMVLGAMSVPLLVAVVPRLVNAALESMWALLR